MKTFLVHVLEIAIGIVISVLIVLGMRPLGVKTFLQDIVFLYTFCCFLVLISKLSDLKQSVTPHVNRYEDAADEIVDEWESTHAKPLQIYKKVKMIIELFYLFILLSIADWFL